MRHLPLLTALAALAGCSSPLPPRAEAAPPLPSASAMSASVSATPTAAPDASAASPVAPPAPREAAPIEDDDPTRGGSRLPLEGGAALSIEMGEPEAPGAAPEVTLTLSRGDQVIAKREGFVAVTGVKPKILTSAQSCESWRAHLRRETFGSTVGVRVSIACTTGEDYFTATELAVLFRLAEPLRDLDGLQRIWAGLGDAQETAMDSCSKSRRVSFRLLNAKALEKTITEEESWTDQVIDGDVKARLKRECKVGTKKRVERVALP